MRDSLVETEQALFRASRSSGSGMGPTPLTLRSLNPLTIRTKRGLARDHELKRLCSMQTSSNISAKFKILRGFW